MAVLIGISSTAVGQNGLCAVGMGANAHWVAAVQQLRTGRIKNGTRELAELIATAGRLPHLEALQIAKQLAKNYHELGKDGPRRAVELALNHLVRPDLLFKAKLQRGLSVFDAYRETMLELTQLTGAEVSFTAADIVAFAKMLQPRLDTDEVHYIEGSAASGKALVAKRSEVAAARSKAVKSHSDIDVVFVKPRWSDEGVGEWIHSRLPRSLRMGHRQYEVELRAEVQEVLAARYPRVTIDVQMHDITPVARGVFEDGDWMKQGVMNNFIVEVRKDGIFLNVFEPAIVPVPRFANTSSTPEPGAVERFRLF